MSAAAVSKRHSPDPASEDSVDARTTRPHRKPLAAQSPRQRPERSCLAPRTAQHRAPQGLKWLSFTPDSGSMLLFLCPSCVSSQVMTSTVFPLHTFGTSNCNVVIEVDDSSLVPSLVKTRLSSMALAGIVPYVYTKQGQAELQELER